MISAVRTHIEDYRFDLAAKAPGLHDPSSNPRHSDWRYENPNAGETFELEGFVFVFAPFALSVRV